MPTARQNATAGLENALARLAELDAEPVTSRVRMTYRDADQEYGWNEYRRALLDQIDAYQKILESVQIAEGPFEVIGGGGWYGGGPWG